VLWDVDSRERLGKPLLVPEGYVDSVAFDPNGKSLAAGYVVPRLGEGGGVVLWDVGRRERLGKPLLVPEGDVRGVAFGPDGKSLAAGYVVPHLAESGGVVLWDVDRRERLGKPLAVPEGYVDSVAFGPDGKYLAAEEHEDQIPTGGLVLWDVGRRERLGRPLLVPEGDVRGVAFGPDGKSLAAGYAVPGHKGGVVLWDMDLGSWKAHARQIANRNFTRAEWQQYFPDTPYRRTFRTLPWPSDLPEDEREKAEQRESEQPEGDE
jgi:WD40 repeat protein